MAFLEAVALFLFFTLKLNRTAKKKKLRSQRSFLFLLIIFSGKRQFDKANGCIFSEFSVPVYIIFNSTPDFRFRFRGLRHLVKPNEVFPLNWASAKKSDLGSRISDVRSQMSDVGCRMYYKITNSQIFIINQELNLFVNPRVAFTTVEFTIRSRNVAM